jgi:hypothetical protein
MKYMAAVVIGFFVSSAGAEEFCLKHDASGKVYGPFQTEAGAKVALGTTTFTVVKPASAASAVETKLAGIKIPQLELRHAALQDAVEFLKMQTQLLDPKRTGVNFVIAKAATPKKTLPDDPFGGAGGAFDLGPIVTLSLKDVSALQVLKSLMEQTGYSYKTSANTVTIYPK